MSIRLMNFAWDSAVSIAQKIVLISLADQANDDGACWPSTERLTRRCSMDRRTVQRALSGLEDEGYIQRHERPGRSTWYMIGITENGDGAFPVARGGTKSHQDEGAAETTKRGGRNAQRCDSLPPITISNHHVTLNPPYNPPKGGRRAKSSPAIGTETYSDLFEEFWKRWPKGKGGVKAKAYQSWLKLQLDDHSMESSRFRLDTDVAARIEKDSQWARGYVPHMTTYLNGSGWTADIDTSTGPQANGRAKTSYEQVMEASATNRAALAEDLERDHGGFFAP